MRQESQIDVLREAARVVRRRGLARKVFEAPDGGVCTFGAVNVAATGTADSIAYTEYQQFLAHRVRPYVLEDITPESAFSIVARWSDEEAADAEEVASFLEDAADHLEAQLAKIEQVTEAFTVTDPEMLALAAP